MASDEIDGRTLRRRETRRRMLEAARHLIEEHGAAQVTLAAVAREAGITRQTVYAHMGSRGGLLLALVDHVDTENELGRRLQPVRQAPDAPTAIRRFLVVTAELTPLILPIARALDRVRVIDDDVAAAWEDRMAGRRRTCVGLVRRLADEGGLGAGWSLDAAADLLYAAISIQNWEILVEERGWTAEAWAERMADVVLGALGADSGG